MQHNKTHCNTLQRTATNALQRCKLRTQRSRPFESRKTATTLLSGFAMLQCICCSVLQRVAACCSVLQCVVVYCSVLHCVTVCCSVLQCVAVCCSVSQQRLLPKVHVQSHGVSLKFRECNAPNPRGIRLGIAIEAACAFSVYYFVCHGEAMGLGEFAQDVMEFVRV